MPLPASRLKPASCSCRQATPQASTIVRARRTSPPSRWTSRVAASIRSIDRVPGSPRRAGAPATARGSRARRPTRRTGTRGSSRSATRCPPARRAPRARRRSSAGPPRRRRRPRPGPPGRRRRSPRRTRRARAPCRGRAARPPGGARPDHRLPADEPDRRQVGVCGGVPPHTSAASAASRREPRKVTGRPMEEAAQLGGVRLRPMANDDHRARRRRPGGQALQPARRRDALGRGLPTSSSARLGAGPGIRVVPARLEAHEQRVRRAARNPWGNRPS